jgi:hypothetical protein
MRRRVEGRRWCRATTSHAPHGGLRGCPARLRGVRSAFLACLLLRDGSGRVGWLLAGARSGRGAGLGWCLIEHCLATRTVARSGPRGPARPLPHRVGRRAHERLRRGGRRAPARARDRQAGGVTPRPPSIAMASSPRTAKRTGMPIEVEREGRATRRRWGSAASGPKPGPAAASASHDRRVSRGCERIDRSRLRVGVRFLLRCSPTLRPGC